MLSSSKMYRWVRRWALATLLQRKMAISESRLTVKTCSDLTHAYDLWKSSANPPIEIAWLKVIEEPSSLSAYQGEDDHVIVGKYSRFAQTSSEEPHKYCGNGQGDAYCSRDNNVRCSIVMNMRGFILDLGW